MRAALIFTAFTCLLGSSVQAATSDTQQLLDLEQRWLTAAMQHDAVTLQQVLADDFVDVTYQGGLRDKTDHLHSSLTPGKTKQTLEIGRASCRERV